MRHGIDRAAIRGLLGVALLLGLAGAGCPKKEWADAPEGFVEVKDGRFVFKAVAPDGSTIAVRHRGNPEEGDLDFWTEVFELEMVDGQGYRAAGKSDLQSGDGVAGRLLRFEYAAGDVPYHYGVALYVTGKSIVTVETAAELEKLPRYESAFEAVRTRINARAGD
jgi:hypothetical protein